jgi:SPW repeat
MKWSAWITVLAGVCLLAAPFATGYNTLSNVATAEAVVLGVLIAGLGLWTALGAEVPTYVDYLLMVGGAWSIIAPFALAYSNTTSARNSDVMAGIVVAAVAVYRAFLASPDAHQKVTA